MFQAGDIRDLISVMVAHGQHIAVGIFPMHHGADHIGLCSDRLRKSRHIIRFDAQIAFLINDLAKLFERLIKLDDLLLGEKPLREPVCLFDQPQVTDQLSLDIRPQ